MENYQLHLDFDILYILNTGQMILVTLLQNILPLVLTGLYIAIGYYYATQIPEQKHIETQTAKTTTTAQQTGPFLDQLDVRKSLATGIRLTAAAVRPLGLRPPSPPPTPPLLRNAYLPGQLRRERHQLEEQLKQHAAEIEAYRQEQIIHRWSGYSSQVLLSEQVLHVIDQINQLEDLKPRAGSTTLGADITAAIKELIGDTPVFEQQLRPLIKKLLDRHYCSVIEHCLHIIHGQNKRYRELLVTVARLHSECHVHADLSKEIQEARTFATILNEKLKVAIQQQFDDVYEQLEATTAKLDNLLKANSNVRVNLEHF